MPATAQASSIHSMLCPITGPAARQMIEFRDRLHPGPGAFEAYAADHGRHLRSLAYTSARTPPDPPPAWRLAGCGRFASWPARHQPAASLTRTTALAQI